MSQLKSKVLFIIYYLTICLFSSSGQFCFAAAPSPSPAPTSTVLPLFSPIPTSTTSPSFSPITTPTDTPSISPKPTLLPTYSPTTSPTVFPTAAPAVSPQKDVPDLFPSNSWSIGENPFPIEEPSIVQDPPTLTKSPTEVEKNVQTEKNNNTSNFVTLQISSENSVPFSANISSLQEEVTESYTKINGVRLQYLLEVYPDYVPFEHNGILLQLPSRFLKNLNLSNNDSLWVELIKTDLYSFTLSIRINKVDIIELSNAKIQFPVNIKKNYTLYFNNEKTEIPIRYENKIACFTIYKTGEYSLKTSEENKLPLTASFTNTSTSDYNISKHKVIIIPAIVGIIVISCLYILFKRKRSYNEKANLT